MSVFFDQHNTRFTQKSQDESKNVNWLFIPGGPGCDSSCFDNLFGKISLPGNVWLIDFAENGSNYVEEYDDKYDFSKWSDALIAAVSRFDNPILVGHSFGGVLALLHPELENLLEGLVLIGTQPKYDEKDIEEYANNNGLSYDKAARKKFRENPSSNNFRNVLLAKAHYHFPEQSIDKGKKLFSTVPFNYYSAIWWSNKLKNSLPEVTWAPNLPCLILNGDKDFISPMYIYDEDDRFSKNNIDKVILPDAGHFPWFEKPEEIGRYLLDFLSKLSVC